MKYWIPISIFVIILLLSLGFNAIANNGIYGASSVVQEMTEDTFGELADGWVHKNKPIIVINICWFFLYVLIIVGAALYG